MDKVKVGIIGLGNVGLNLMLKIMKSEYLEMKLAVDVVESGGLKKAKELGIKTSIGGVEAVVADPEIQICFDATGAEAHKANAPLLKKAGKVCIDMTPAAMGPYVVPCLNLDMLDNTYDYSMITCAGQATIPIVAAINDVADVEYAEVAVSISTKSAGSGTRENIDEITQTTADGLKVVGGANTSKAIIVLNPADPPLMMTNTIYCRIKNKKEHAIKEAVDDVIERVQQYVPGYKLRVPPLFEDDKVMCIVQVESTSDDLQAYAGNLDIINCAAVSTAEAVAAKQ